MRLEHETVFFIACDWCQERGPEVIEWDATEVARAVGFRCVDDDSLWLCKECHVEWCRQRIES